jgi:two-component system sensor histidine kinase UhpB
MVGRRLADVFPEVSDRPFYHAYQRVMHGGPGEVMEEYYTPWGRWFENRIQRSPEGISVFFREITDRKRLERSQAAANRVLRTSAACSEVMASAADEATLLEATCRIAAEQGGYLLVWVALAGDNNARTVLPAAAAGPEAGYLTEIELTWRDDASGHGPVGTAIRTGTAQTVRDLAESTDVLPWRDAALRHGFAAIAAVPLVSGERRLGAISFYSAENDAFDAGELGLLTELSRKLAAHLLAVHARQDHARAALALADREARLRLATEGSNIGLWDWDLRDNTVYFSPIWKRQLGFADHEVTNAFEEWRKRIHPDDLARALATVGRYIAAPWSDYELEVRLQHQDGSYRHILARAVLVRDDAGQPARMLGSHLDVTELRQLTADLQSSRNQLQSFARRLENVREEQSARLAQQVHDVLGQQLTALKLDLALLRRMTAAQPAVVTKIRESSQLVDDSITTVQQIATELRPSTLDKLGLGPTLAQELRSFQQRTGAICTPAIDETPLPYDNPTTTGIYRIVQEALTNVARHAGATRVSLDLSYSPLQGLKLVVADNGCGFETSGRARLGLIGMQERAIFVGGRLDIRSTAGLGTTVTLWVPPPKR